MALVVVNNGENIALSYLVNKVTTPENLVYRLYTGNVTPAETDTAASYSEASGGGYASKTCTGSSWTVTNGAPTTATYTALVWTFTGALNGNATIYGYYVTRASTGDLVFAESFSAFTPATNGDNLTINPQITAD